MVAKSSRLTFPVLSTQNAILHKFLDFLGFNQPAMLWLSLNQSLWSRVAWLVGVVQMWTMSHPSTSDRVLHQWCGWCADRLGWVTFSIAGGWCRAPPMHIEWECERLALRPKNVVWVLLFVYFFTSLVAQTVKRLPTMQETWVQSLGQEDPLEKKMAPTPVFWPGKSHGPRNLVGYSPWGRKEPDKTERLHFTSLHFTLPCYSLIWPCWFLLNSLCAMLLLS